MSCQLQQTGCRGSYAEAVDSHYQQQDEGLLCFAVGPYPDEVIMSALDRILYYLGATKILHQLELPNLPATHPEIAPPPTQPSLPCTATNSTSICSLMGKVDSSKGSSNTCISKYTSAKSQNSVKGFIVPKTSSIRSHSPSPSPSPSHCPSHSHSPHKTTVSDCRPHPRRPRVDFAHPVIDDRMTSGGPSISSRLKQSLSTCSLACRRLKSKLTASKDEHCVWTRLVHSDNGSKIYEVYQKPLKNSAHKQPVIVFLVLPNGIVMPFEAIPSSYKDIAS